MTRTQTLPLEQVSQGMVLGAGILDANGSSLLAAGTVLSAAHLNSLQRRNVQQVDVEVREVITEAEREARDEKIRARLCHLFRRAGEGEADRLLYQALLAYRLEGDGMYTPADFPRERTDKQPPPAAPPITLDEVLADIRHLPSLPAVVSELIQTLDNESAGIDQLAEGVAKDQSLAASALRVANSPFYGIQHKVSSIHDAIVILGFRAVGSLVMAASVTGYFSPPDNVAFDLKHFWRHGLGTALCARALARHAGLDAEAGFSAGLLHDIGMLMLLTSRPGNYAQVLAYRNEHDCHVPEAEQAVLGFDHARAGEALITRWRFPMEIVRAVALHHAPEGRPENNTSASLADVVHVANILAHALDLAGAPQALVPSFKVAAWYRLGLDEVNLKAMLPSIEREHEGYCALLAS